MDTYKKHSIAKLWIAGAMMMAFFFATSALAQDTTAVDSTDERTRDRCRQPTHRAPPQEHLIKSNIINK